MVTCQGRVVAQHDRCWAGHHSITADEHATVADRLREQARRARLRPVAEGVEQRVLADYDRALGLDTSEDAVSSPGSEGQGVA